MFVANTGSASLSVRLKPETKKRLAKLAQADRQVKSGHYIRNEDVKVWLLSWGTKHELPVLRCVCGKQHDGEKLCL